MFYGRIRLFGKKKHARVVEQVCNRSLTGHFYDLRLNVLWRTTAPVAF
jgi:hypothetical protein